MTRYSHADTILARWGDPRHWDGSQSMSPELARQYRDTVPVPGRPGWRVDREGIEWFSSAWLDQRHAVAS